jgi:integral membrane sensor domain MASE1
MAQVKGQFGATLTVLTLVYFAAGRLGLSLAFINDSASAVWPPTGIALAALLVLGLGAWPAILAGAFLVNVTTSGAVLPSIAIAIGNTLEGVVGAWLIMRYAFASR